MNKVILNKEEAEALEIALEINGGDKASVVHWHAQNLFDGKRAPLNELDLDTICNALYVGYEVERDTEEKVFELYNSYHPGSAGRYIVKNVLDLLNVQIKGVNC